jgi:hypothetical protein
MSNATNQWIEKVVQKLSQDGFEISRNVVFDKYTFKVVATRSKTKMFGKGDAFFIFSEFDVLNFDTLQRFSANAFNAADTMKFAQIKLGKKLRNDPLVCFPVAIVRSADNSVIDELRTKTLPRHLGAFEIPVLFDAGRQKLFYFEKIPFWGFVFYFGFRSLIKKYLFEAI